MTPSPTRNVAVFGASGNIGRHVVDQLLAAGHHVTAYVRNPAKLGVIHPNLRIVQGELTDAAAIAEAVDGADAVINALGPTRKRSATGTPVTDGTRYIVRALQAASVRRYLGLATPAVADERDKAHGEGEDPAYDARLAFPNALTEITGMTDVVRNSGLDWTIARITSPSDKPAKDTIRAGFLGWEKVGAAMTRADIARFLVGQLADDTFLRAAPGRARH